MCSQPTPHPQHSRVVTDPVLTAQSQRARELPSRHVVSDEDPSPFSERQKLNDEEVAHSDLRDRSSTLESRKFRRGYARLRSSSDPPAI